MTPKQRSAHLNARRSRLKGRALLLDGRILYQRMTLPLAWDRQLQKMWDLADRYSKGIHSFRSYASTYEQMFTQYALTGHADTLLFVDELGDIEARARAAGKAGASIKYERVGDTWTLHGKGLS